MPVDRGRQPGAGQDELVGPGGGDDRRPAVDLLAVDPGPDPAVVEAHDPAVPQRDRPADALDAPDDVGSPLTDRHQVGDADLAAVGRVRRLEHGRVVDVAPRRGVLARPARSASGRCGGRRAAPRSRRGSRTGAGRASPVSRRCRSGPPCGRRRWRRTPRSGATWTQASVGQVGLTASRLPARRAATRVARPWAAPSR